MLITRLKPWFLPVLLIPLLAGGCRGKADSGDGFAVGLTGVQQMGRNFSITEFYADGYYGSNVGREGGGGSDVCCVVLPSVWRPDLAVDLRWAVADWSNENREETEKGNFRSIIYMSFRARVPIEPYTSPDRLWIHFFPDGKARALTNGRRSWEIRQDPAAETIATKGAQTTELFTQAELKEMERKSEAHAKRFGDW